MSIFPTKILLATDGSEEAALATQTAVDIADKTGSELHVVLVGLSAAYVGMGPPEIADIPAPRQQELNEEAQRLLNAQVEQIKADGGTVVQAHLRIGKSDEQIVALAEEIGAGLIVMGSRGLGGIRRLLMGSVSNSVVRHAHCPVLIVRAQKRGWRYPEGSVSTVRQPRCEGAEKKRSFWDTLFGPYPSWQEVKVLECVVHRFGEGAHLRDVMQEEYVRRLISPDEVEDILDNPKLIEAARKKMEEDLSSGKLDLRKPTRRMGGTVAEWLPKRP
jgi:nucleotide-binding universal stress UspA family protein